MDYYFADGDVQKGPFPKSQLTAEGLRADSLVWREGMAEWQRADTLDELADVLGPAQMASAWMDMTDRGLDAPARSGPGIMGASDSGGILPPTGPLPPVPPAPVPQPAAPLMAYGGYAHAGAGTPPSGFAVASLVLGIVALPSTLLYCLGVPCALLAVIFGHIARGRARRNVGGGAGMALAGLICGYIVLSIVILLVVVGAIAIGIGAANSGSRSYRTW